MALEAMLQLSYSLRMLLYRHFSKITALRILAKLGQKSKGDELGTVTRPDFPGKIYLINYA